MTLRNFELDDEYITDVHIYKEWSMYDGKETLTNEELLKVLQGKDKCSSSSHIDHPEFTKLRNQLEELGYIKTQRNWWNGDRVLKSFKLNGWTFRKNHKFPCAAALNNSIKCAKKFNWKTISSY